MRDDFPEQTKRILALRVGNRCSRCRAITSGPQVTDTGAVNIGVAAHITAAAPGGPRFDATLTAAQRRSIDNALWLCQSCGALVDRDAKHYTAALLRSWRHRAEAETRNALGRQQEAADSVAPTYERLVSDTNHAFTLLLNGQNAFEPNQLFQLLDESTANFLREASRYLGALAVEPRVKDVAIPWGAAERESFEYFSFVLMARGFLLDRYLLTNSLRVAAAHPPLPELDELMERWYESILTNTQWIEEWSTPFTRDLVDAQWLSLKDDTAQAYGRDDRIQAIIMPVLRFSLLQGMVAHQFIVVGAPGVEPREE